MTILALAVSLSLLSACSTTSNLRCQPVPEDWTNVPPKPTGKDLQVGKSTNRDIARKMYALDQWGEQMAGQLEDIERHQAPCRQADD